MKAALVISSRDNVATALEALDAGRTIEVAGMPGLVLSVVEPIPPGHKVALRAIAAGEPVLKYGSPIGLASAGIAAGTHVHTHNLASSRGRGDLAPPQRTDDPRPAEPPDARIAPPPDAQARGARP